MASKFFKEGGLNLLYIDKNATPMKVVGRIGDREFCYNHEYKLIEMAKDESVGYREDEIDPAVKIVIEEARAVYRYPGINFIDHVIDMQHDRSIGTAVKYAQYRLLGKATYLEVYGAEAQNRDKEEQNHKELLNIINQLREENKETQQLLLNMAMVLQNMQVLIYK